MQIKLFPEHFPLLRPAVALCVNVNLVLRTGYDPLPSCFMNRIGREALVCKSLDLGYLSLHVIPRMRPRRMWKLFIFSDCFVYVVKVSLTYNRVVEAALLKYHVRRSCQMCVLEGSVVDLPQVLTAMSMRLLISASRDRLTPVIDLSYISWWKTPCF